jgi:hypothetical protein
MNLTMAGIKKKERKNCQPFKIFFDSIQFKLGINLSRFFNDNCYKKRSLDAAKKADEKKIENGRLLVWYVQQKLH